jgi:hypothetical protein
MEIKNPRGLGNFIMKRYYFHLFGIDAIRDDIEQCFQIALYLSKGESYVFTKEFKKLLYELSCSIGMKQDYKSRKYIAEAEKVKILIRDRGNRDIRNQRTKKYDAHSHLISSLSVKEICKKYNVSRTTGWRMKQRYNKE